ncbi:MAG: hypothetical protein ACBR14_23100, partial [Microcoleus sp.]
PRGDGGRGTKEKTPVPPFLRGARGDLALIVKQQSVTGFDVKLILMDKSVPLRFLVLVSQILKLLDSEIARV